MLSIAESIFWLLAWAGVVAMAAAETIQPGLGLGPPYLLCSGDDRQQDEGSTA